MSLEDDEGGRGCLERGVLRNSKRFSAVFDRLYFKVVKALCAAAIKVYAPAIVPGSTGHS